MRVAAAACRRAVCLAWLLLAAFPATAGYRFETGFYLGEADLMVDWAAALARHRADEPLLEDCLATLEACPAHLRGVHALVGRAAGLGAAERVQLVNRYVNRRPYRNDRPVEVESRVAEALVRLPGRWSSLAEFLARGGDCQDYATAKYHLLRRLGFAAEDLRVVVTWERGARGHHALLAVRFADGAVWLLDSDNAIYRDGKPFGTRFVFAINEQSVWDHEPRAGAWRSTPETPEREGAS